MIDIIKAKVTVEYVDDDYIQITKTRKAKGAFRWNYDDERGEIKIARKATDRTLLHEYGHAMNYILGNGERYSDKVGIESEKFADIVADILALCYNPSNN